MAESDATHAAGPEPLQEQHTSRPSKTFDSQRPPNPATTNKKLRVQLSWVPWVASILRQPRSVGLQQRREKYATPDATPCFLSPHV